MNSTGHQFCTTLHQVDSVKCVKISGPEYVNTRNVSRVHVAEWLVFFNYFRKNKVYFIK